MAKRTTTTRKTTKNPQAKVRTKSAANKTVTTTLQKQAYDFTPGTKLTRMFKGEDVTVQVTENGFVYQGETFKSISAVARHICGYQVSGPVFFGLAETVGGETKS
jgi:hypothetical protein